MTAARTRKIFIWLLGLALLLLIWLLRSVLTPFLLAALLAYVLAPAVTRLERRGTPLVAAIVVVYVYMLLTLAVLGKLCLPLFLEQGRNLLDYLPQLAESIQQMLSPLQNVVQLPELTELLGAYGERALLGAAESMPQLFSVILYAFLTPVLAFYLLRDRKSLSARGLRLLTVNSRPEFLRVCRDIDRLIRQFLTSYVSVALITGFLSTLFYYAAGVDYPLVLGLLMTIADLIPYFGPVLGALPAVIIALGTSRRLALITVVGLLAIQQLESAVISPRIVGERLGLHPLLVILAVTSGAYLFGLLGAVCAVPLAAALILLLRYVYCLLVGETAEKSSATADEMC